MKAEPKRPPLHYNLAMRFFHWLMVLLLPPMFYLGGQLNELGLATAQNLLRWHVTLGLMILLLVLPRLFVAGLSEKPDISGSGILRVLAKVVHILIYVLLVLVPVSGYFLLTETSLSLSAVFFQNFERLDSAYRDSFLYLSHEFLAWSFAALLAVHLLAVTKHSLIDKDGTLSKMLGRSER